MTAPTEANLAACIVAHGSTIRDGLEALDRGAAGIALAVDANGRLVGVATDGDLRRALLAGAALVDPIAPALTSTFARLGPGATRADALDLMTARRIDALPVVDDTGRPVALHLLQRFLQPADRPNWAVIMAGGRGTRLAPLTDSVPKPMLRVAGRPILERIVLHLVGHGIGRIFIAVNYLAPVIEAHFGDGSNLGARIEYLREQAPLGTAGALALLPTAPEHPILVLNGDLVTTVNVADLLDAHERWHHAITVGIRRYVHTVPFGCVDRDGDVITALEEKPTIVREVNTGIYAIAARTLGLLRAGEAIGMPDLIGRVMAGGETIGAFEVEGDWVDVGQREQLRRAREGA